ncbi:unnamed protein product [Blepharisma stoltei]|uniref:Uncharacterized protein n=1 Tax=Blepharisma stoltei TaxID=1481888 RepID=A0AAU9KHA0_9CILI|nr:unnamed protein product [Blepharisma stoltei]
MKVFQKPKHKKPAIWSKVNSSDTNQDFGKRHSLHYWREWKGNWFACLWHWKWQKRSKKFENFNTFK